MVRNRAAVLAAALAVAGLTGVACGSDDGDDVAATTEATDTTSTTRSAAESTSTAPDDDGSDDGSASDCFVGEWVLDTDDYSAQALAYLGGLGIPVESVVVSGEQVVTFQDEVMDVRTDMQVDAVIAGVPISATSQDAGNGEWTVVDGALTVENWLWGIEPTPAAPGAPSVPLFDPTRGATTATCAGDQLSLQGAGAPLTGNFVRR